MGNRRNAHAYSPDEIERLKGIPLPEKIKCGRCLKNVHWTNFSSKQLTDARRQVRDHRKITQSVSCKSCTGKQVMEMQCVMCRKTRGLEEFAKTQRNKPDTAKCFACMEAQVTEEAVNEHRYTNPATAFVTPESSNGNMPEYFSSNSSTTDSYDDREWNPVNGRRRNDSLDDEDDDDGGVSLIGGIQQMGFHDATTDTLISTADGHSNGDGPWHDVRARSWHTQSRGPTSATTPSSLNNHSRPSMPSASSRTFRSSQAERSNASEYGSSGFIRNSAISRGTTPSMWSQSGPVRPMGDTQREYGDDVEDEDVSSDIWDSDDDDDDDTVI